ncbi:FUSC family protein [Oxalobacteraceae bacterium]|nr:FUSC family protein [Oxalobacteraceae bacterium]
MTPEPIPLPSPPAPAVLTWLRTQARDWAGSEGERWIFVAKTLLAGFGALWIAFRLGLDSPGTALTTTFILALPSSGMVLEKAFYRLLGTLVGCCAALLMTALLPQQPFFLFIVLAAWIGLCTCGAALHRNQQSYSFVLAGYTACMIAIPAIAHPPGVFALAVTRMTEVGLGILVAAVVHDALFPRHQSRQVMRTVQARYAGFLDFCSGVLENRLAPADVELAHLRYAADIAALESGRAAAFFEATHARADTRQLHAFNGAFMAALTTFYTLHRLLHRLRQQQGSRLPALLEPLSNALALELRAELDTGGGINRLRAGLPGHITTAMAALGRPERAERIDCETALELLERCARDIGAFADSHAALGERKRQLPSEPQAYSPRTPPAIVLASGFRAACALLLAAAIWYWMAWPYLGSATLMSTIFCALASSSPRPTAMVHQVLMGFLLAWPLSFVCEFFAVIHAGDFPMLVLAALPLFALGAYLSTGPRRAGVGVGISLFSAQVIAPANLMHVDVAGYLNATLALPAGVLLAYVIFSVLLPEHTMGQKDHIAAALWREARSTCGARLPRLKRRFDNRVRDLLSQLNAAAGPAPVEAIRAVLRQGLTLLELGHSVIELRGLLASSQPGPVRNGLELVIDMLAAYLRTPTSASNAEAQYVILQAGAPLRAAQAEAQQDGDSARVLRLQTALSDLHSIYTSLLDQMPQLPTHPGAHHHAA